MRTKDFTVRYGLRMFAAVAGLFVLTNLLGLGHITELRALNIFIVIYFTSKLAQKNVIEDDRIGYLKNLSSLFFANVVNVVLCIVGFTIYVELIQPDYMSVVQSTFSWGHFDHLFQVCLALLMEGMAAGAVVSFGVMQYWKNYKRERKSVQF